MIINKKALIPVLLASSLCAHAEIKIIDSIRAQIDEDPLAAAGSNKLVSLKTTMHIKNSLPPPNDITIMQSVTQKNGKFATTLGTSTNPQKTFNNSTQFLVIYSGRLALFSGATMQKIAYKASPESPPNEVKYFYHSLVGEGTEYQTLQRIAQFCKLAESRKADTIISKLPGGIYKYSCEYKHTTQGMKLDHGIDYYSDYLNLVLSTHFTNSTEILFHENEIEFFDNKEQRVKSKFGDLRKSF